MFVSLPTFSSLSLSLSLSFPFFLSQLCVCINLFSLSLFSLLFFSSVSLLQLCIALLLCQISPYISLLFHISLLCTSLSLIIFLFFLLPSLFQNLSIYLFPLFIINTWVSQKFCNILVMWDMIQLLQMLLLRLWRWQTSLDWDMLSSPDTPQMLLIEFASMAWIYNLWIHGFRPTWLYFCIKIVIIQAKFLKPADYCTGIKCVFTFCTTNIFGCFCGIMAQCKLVKH